MFSYLEATRLLIPSISTPDKRMKTEDFILTSRGCSTIKRKYWTKVTLTKMTFMYFGGSPNFVVIKLLARSQV